MKQCLYFYLMFLKRNLRTYSHLEDSWEFYSPFTIPSPLSYIPMALLLNHHKNITNLKNNKIDKHESSKKSLGGRF